MRPQVFVAAKKGDIKTLQSLHGQNSRFVCNDVSFEGNTVLHIAAREGHLEIVRWILDVKPSLAGARNSDKNTPLHEAAKNGDAEVVKILLEHKLRAVWRRNQFGETALIIASQHGHLEAARLLLANTPLYLVFWPRADRQTCLNAAAYEGHLDVMHLILKDQPGCFNILKLILLIDDEYGATPLHAAVHRGHLEIASEIVDTKFSWWCGCFDKSLMTKKDKLGRCAIHIAAMKGHEGIVSEFMFRMPDCVEIRSTSLKTAVHFAVEYNQFDIVKKLLVENVDEVNAKLVSYDYDICGNTALHLAAMNGVDPELVKYLLSFPGVKLNSINNEGRSPLDIAIVASTTDKNNPNFSQIASILKAGGATESLIRHSNSNSNSNSKLPPWQYSQHTPHQSSGGYVENKILDVDTLVASLIATVTFAAIFQVPGGMDDHTNIAKMALETTFQVFLFSDCLAFFASMTVVISWIFRERLQTKLIADRSPLAKLSMLSLGISIVSTGLAFLSATILVTVPRHLQSHKNKLSDKEFNKYQLIFSGEILTAFAAPLVALVFLSLAWVFEYHFNASNERQVRLKWQLKQVLISTLPVATIILVILFVYITKN